MPEPAGSSPVAAYFSRLADSYGGGEYYGRRRAATIGAISGEIAHARSILDLGCGNGAYLQNLVAIARHAAIVGVDLSADMLSAARRRVDARASFVQADAAALPFTTESFDLIFCSHVLQFVSDIGSCVAGVARILRPGGVLITTLDDRSLRRVFAAISSPEDSEDWLRVMSRPVRAARANRSGDDGYQVAFQSASLLTESRTAPFQVTGADIEEWLRVRWMPVTPEPDRAAMERILARFREDERLVNLKLDLTERMLSGASRPDSARSRLTSARQT